MKNKHFTIFSALLFLTACAEPLTLMTDDLPVPFQQKPGESQFAFIERSILAPKCVACHNGPSSPHGIDLTSYAKIMNAQRFPPLIVRGEPESSSLYDSVKSGRMPKDARPLTQTELSLLRNWITDGARESDREREDTTPLPNPTPTEPPSDPNEPPDDPAPSAPPADPNEPPDDF